MSEEWKKEEMRGIGKKKERRKEMGKRQEKGKKYLFNYYCYCKLKYYKIVLVKWGEIFIESCPLFYSVRMFPFVF